MSELVMHRPATPDELICSNRYGTFFGVPQAVFDAVWNRLTDPAGATVVYVSMEIGADPDVFHPLLNFLKRKGISESPDARVDALIKKYLNGPRKIPNYSGGLGVLAGDTLKSFADTRVPALAISLLYREGYFSQIVDSKFAQIEPATGWVPEETPTLFQLRDPAAPDQPLTIEVPFLQSGDERPTVIKAQVWMKLEIADGLDYFVPEFMLD